MKNYFQLFYLFSLFKILLADLQLKQVIEVCRHGARGPLYNFWNIEQVWQTYQWQASYNLYNYRGQLTPVGERQHYILGQTLRQRYIEDQQYLSSSYNFEEMYVRSTNVNRTIMSAQYQLMGLYPLGTGPNLPNNYPQSRAVPPYTPITYNYSQLGNGALQYNEQLIPIFNVPRDTDYLLLPFDPSVCPGQNEFLKLNAQSQVFQVLTQQMQPYMDQLQQILSIEEKLDLPTTAHIVDDFMVDLYANQPIPNISKALWEKLTFIYNSFNLICILFPLQVTDYLLYFASQEQKQMVTTNFFQELQSRFDSKINNTNDTLKFIFYSAHDTTVQALLAGLNLSNYQCQYDIYNLGSTDFPNCITEYPYYATSILFELYYDTDQQEYFIKILYNGLIIVYNYLFLLREYQNICNTNSTICSYNEFSSLLSASELSNFLQICQNGPTLEMIENIKKQFGIKELKDEEIFQKKGFLFNKFK